MTPLELIDRLDNEILSDVRPQDTASAWEEFKNSTERIMLLQALDEIVRAEKQITLTYDPFADNEAGNHADFLLQKIRESTASRLPANRVCLYILEQYKKYLSQERDK